MPERLDPYLFQFYLHLETCEVCQSSTEDPADHTLCGHGLHLLYHAAQAGEIDLVTPIMPAKVSFDTAAPLRA